MPHKVIQATTMGMGMLKKNSMRNNFFANKIKFLVRNVLLFYSTNTGRFGQGTYHHHVYTPAASSNSNGWASGGGGGGGHKSKSSSLQTSALTLLAFLFFINMLHTCLKEQMTSLNPTVCFTVHFFCKLKRNDGDLNNQNRFISFAIRLW